MIHRHNRSGVTLLECVATLSVLMVLAMAAVKMLSSVTSIGLQTNRDKMSRVAIERLSTTFRQDISSAENISLTDDGTSISIQRGDATIQYTTNASANKPSGTADDEHAIYRSQTADKAVTGNDRFLLTARCTPVFLQKGQMVTLRLTPDGHLNPWIIKAVQK